MHILEINNPVLYSIWKDRYCKNDEDVEGNLRRVAKYCSNNISEEESFFNVMNDALFFPGGRTISNAGIGKNLTLNNCFVSPQIKDDLDDIFNKVKLGAVTHQKGGGIGYDFSQLRPKGSPTSNDAIASGPVSFMDVFNSQTSTILQGSRRGANMGVMNIYSMDIEEFILSKSTDENSLVHFNISVMVDDDFMKAKDRDEDIWLHHPVYDNQGNIITDESKWIYKKKINAKYLWELIVKQAYNTGEPGVLFYNNLNNDNPLYYIENIICSNPCAEYVSGIIYGNNPINGELLNPDDFGGACNLGSIMLHNFIENPFTSLADMNYDKLKETINIAVRFLDNIIDRNKFPDIIYKNYQESFRTIGLGVTGLADTLTMLNLKYSSQEALNFVDKLMNFITLHAYKSSIELAKEKGPFPFLDKDKYIKNNYLKKHNSLEWETVISDIMEYGIRNSKLLSLAPTGTMSLVFGKNCSSGIEPIFSLSYDRKIKIGGQNEDNIKIIKMEDYAYKLWKETTDDNIVKENIFQTSMNLSVKDHINMLGIISYHVDMSCSKTINVPTEYSFENTKKIYDLCWENKIKGCTIFRPNEIRKGILITEEEKTHLTATDNYENLPWGATLLVSDELIGRKRKIISGCGSLHLQAWYDPKTKKLMEIFLSKGSNGGCNSFMTGLSRVISLALRTGASFDYTIDQLKSTPPCTSYVSRNATKKDCSKGNSCPSAIAFALTEIQKELDKEEIKMINMDSTNIENNLSLIQKEFLEKNGEIAFSKKFHICPSCHTKLGEIQDGCLQCNICGWSKCG